MTSQLEHRCFITDYTDRDIAIAGLIDQLFYRSRLYSCFWRGEEAAWTKINGSGVHAHTDTYLCIVARSHSWIHINCVARSHTVAMTRAARYRFAYPVTREQSLQSKTKGSFVIHFRRLFVFEMCHKYMNMTARNTACGEWSLRWRDKL